MLVQEFNILCGPFTISDILEILEELFNFQEDFKFISGNFGIGSLNDLLKFINLGLEKLDILGDEFTMNDIHISLRINVTFLMDDVWVIKTSDDVIDSINCLNVREESVSETSTLGSTFHQTSDIGYGDCSGDL